MLFSSSSFGEKWTLRAIDLLFDSNFFQSLGSIGKITYFQLYLSIKDLIFDIVCRSFTVYSWFNASVTAYWKHVPSLFFKFIVALLFLSSLENLFTIRHDSDIFYDICNICNPSVVSKTKKRYPFTDVSKPIWYLVKSD